MAGDKYSALWVSYSSIQDFLNCPRSYFLKNVYKSPKTGHKITLMNPALALGQTVHNVLDKLSFLPHDQRFKKPLIALFDEEWEKVSGKRGGFFSPETEYKYKVRGQEMMRRVYNHPGIIKNLSVKITQELPQFWLSEEENIILCGKIDWLEYLPTTDSVHIVDFKTSKKEDNSDSLQLPIYHLLVDRCQKRKVSKVSYWYLERDNECKEATLFSLEEAYKNVLDVARKIKLARQLDRLTCPNGEDGCIFCKSMEEIIKGNAELVDVDQYKRDIYILNQESNDINTNQTDSIIL